MGTRTSHADTRQEFQESRMAEIVLAMATTHGPQLHTTVEQWQLRVKADRARKHPFRNGVYSFDELVAMRRPEGLDGKSIDGCAARLSRALPCRDGEARRQVGGGRRRHRRHSRQRPGRDLRNRTAQSGRSWCSSATRSRTIRRSEEARKQLPPGIAEAEHGHATRRLHGISRRARSRLAHHQDADATASSTSRPRRSGRSTPATAPRMPSAISIGR